MKQINLTISCYKVNKFLRHFGYQRLKKIYFAVVHCEDVQVQLASAKLAICLKNSVFGFEKLSFFLGLRLSAGSTGKCKISDLFEKLGLRVRKTEGFARSEVKFLCDVLNILVRDVIEV